MPRGRWVLICLLLVLATGLAGCVGGSTEPDGDEAQEDADQDARGRAGGKGNATAPESEGVPAPTLEVGRSFTYATSGVYNTGNAVTVVVAEATANGYLFAGETREDLLEEIAWERTWMGPMDRDLNPRGAHLVLFDFPLADGKTWDVDGGTVTARAADVPGPGGTSIPGFEMQLGDDPAAVTWTYAPSIGYLTSYRSTFMEITITETGSTDAWTWFERAARTWAESFEGRPGADTLDVPGDADAVVLTAGGMGRSASAVVPAPASGGAPWTYETEDAHVYTYDILPAAEGAWTLSNASEPEGYGIVLAAAVTWLENP